MTLGFSVFDKEQILSRWDYLKLVARRDLRYTTPKYFHYISQTVVITPLFIGFFCFYLFGYSEQLQEVYLAILEDKGSFYQGALGLAGISLLAIVIYAWNHRAVSRHVDEIYLDHQDLYFDRNVINLRDIKTLFITSLPF